MIRLLLPLVFFPLLFVVSVQAQDQLPASFQALLDQGQLDFLTPTEQQFKIKSAKPNAFFSTDLLLQKKESGLEVRYAILPSSEHPFDPFPHLKSLTTATHLASNSEQSLLAIHNIDDQILQTVFKADWGGIIYFEPKAQFSKKRYCKMLSLFKEGKATVFLFFLFDDPEEVPEYGTIGLQFKEY